jgi:hypothetical protein
MELPRGEMQVEFVGTDEIRSRPSADSEVIFFDDANYDESTCQDTPSAIEAETFEPQPKNVSDPKHSERPSRPGRLPTALLTTAAALANGGKSTTPQVDPDVFRQGMWVLHGVYGLGQIIALSGVAAERQATIDFTPPTGRMRLLLAEAGLQPVRGG